MDVDTDQISLPSETDKNRVSFDSICRCCLSTNVTLKPIFSSVGSIPQAIFLFTSVKFNQGDGLPGNICLTCLDLLNRCIRFKRKVEAVDFVLQKYVAENLAKTRGEDPIENLEKTMAKASITEYRCPVCNRTYDSKSNYHRHLKVHDSKDNILRCNECGKKFTNKATFKVHQLCHNQSKEQSFPCSICKDTFGEEQDLFIHSSLHEGGTKYNCKGCGKEFENLAKLKRHIPTHFVQKPFKCEKCTMSFAEMGSLTRHYKTHIEQKGKPLCKCSVCGKGFPNQYSLRVHNRNHTGERPWACTHCDKRFTDFRLLNSHKLLHKEYKPYECEECSNRFRHQSTLTAHMRIHTSSRPYRCDKCRKSYKYLWSLRTHKRTHRNEFACNECTQVCDTDASLKLHLQWHKDQATAEPNMEMPPEFFHCKDCSAQFPSRVDLIIHEKLTHALTHECDTCFGKWKTLEELVQHKCNEALEASDKPTPDEMILLPSGEIQDCQTVVNTLLASVSISTPETDQKESTNK